MSESDNVPRRRKPRPISIPSTGNIPAQSSQGRRRGRRQRQNDTTTPVPEETNQVEVHNDEDPKNEVLYHKMS